ncbi:MAG: tRNA-dihydrouridine synthase family protein [Proteobacteria bacterium]|nr:tRNA-dihydrouridine synthase family protein [Pseudomonadota bacterium]
MNGDVELTESAGAQTDGDSPFGRSGTRMKTLGIDFPFMIAPMVGLTNVAFRELIRSYTPAGIKILTFTEMLSTRRLPDEKLSTTNELKTADGEDFFIPQLLGNEEEYIAPSVRKLLTVNPWGFDINMGCPVSHTLRHNWGVRLMGDKSYAARVVEWTKKHSARPVSVKLRGGQGDSESLEYLLEFTEALENAGADWLTIHPRPRAQQHKGTANWQLVREVARARKIPVVGNGDIQTAADAVSLLRDFESDGAMIARAATARPWIVWQIAQKLGYSTPPAGRSSAECPSTPQEEGREYIRACLTLLGFMKIYFPQEDYCLEKFRFFAATGARWYQFGHAFWKMTTKAKTITELHDSIEDFGNKFEHPSFERVKFL